MMCLSSFTHCCEGKFVEIEAVVLYCDFVHSLLKQRKNVSIHKYKTHK